MPRDDEKKAWVSRVLGITPGNATAASAGPLLPLWIDAKERAGEQIGTLQSKLRAMRHPILQRVADQGLNGITGRLQVGLQVALTEFDHAAGEAKETARAKLTRSVAEFQNFLNTDQVLPALEQNPFGVPISLRTELSAAMQAIRDGAERSGSARG